MSGKSKIEWTEHTWNPIVGCSIVSPGCTNCYAMAMAARIEAMGNQPRYAGTTKRVNGNAVWTGQLALAPDSIFLAPLKRKAPTTYFVNSMGDLFHEDCPDEWIDRVFAVMALSPQHTFQILTKRAKRMRDYCQSRSRLGNQHAAFWHAFRRLGGSYENLRLLPLPNVWLGVSCERQEEADERIPHLLQTPAAVRFVSAEPLLGPISFHALNLATERPLDALRGVQCEPDDGPDGYRNEACARLDWVIAGGESGRRARPVHPDWVRSIRDWCKASAVAFFFKQWGSFYPIVDRDNDDPDWRKDYTRASNNPEKFKIINLAGGCGFHGERVHLVQRYSKTAAGRLLDGVEHNAFPIAADAGENTATRILDRARQQGAFD